MDDTPVTETSARKTTKKAHVKKRSIAILLIAVVVVGGAAVAAYMTNGFGLIGEQGAVDSSEESQVHGERTAEITRVGENVSKGNLDAVTHYYDERVATQSTTEDKVAAHREHSIMLSDAGRYEEALVPALAAEKLKPTGDQLTSILVQVALCYENTDQIPEAISYYEKAIVSLDTSDSGYEYRKINYENQIAFLKEQ